MESNLFNQDELHSFFKSNAKFLDFGHGYDITYEIKGTYYDQSIKPKKCDSIDTIKFNCTLWISELGQLYFESETYDLNSQTLKSAAYDFIEKVKDQLGLKGL